MRLPGQVSLRRRLGPPLRLGGIDGNSAAVVLDFADERHDASGPLVLVARLDRVLHDRGELGNALVLVVARARARLVRARSAMAAAAALSARLVILVVRGLRLFLEQRLPVGDRDLIVVRMDFRKGEEAVPIAAIVDEGRLERRLDPRDLREVDVAAQRPLACGFEVKLLDAVTS